MRIVKADIASCWKYIFLLIPERIKLILVSVYKIIFYNKISHININTKLVLNIYELYTTGIHRLCLFNNETVFLALRESSEN